MEIKISFSGFEKHKSFPEEELRIARHLLDQLETAGQYDPAYTEIKDDMQLICDSIRRRQTILEEIKAEVRRTSELNEEHIRSLAEGQVN